MIITAVLMILLLSIILAVYRLIVGPTPQDRVLTIDVLTYQFSAFLVFWAGHENMGGYIDIVLVLAVAVFLVTTLIARYLEKGIR